MTSSIDLLMLPAISFTFSKYKWEYAFICLPFDNPKSRLSSPELHSHQSQADSENNKLRRNRQTKPETSRRKPRAEKLRRIDCAVIQNALIQSRSGQTAFLYVFIDVKKVRFRRIDSMSKLTWTLI